MKVQTVIHSDNKSNTSILQKTKIQDSLQEMKKLVKFYQVVVKSQFLKMIFEINIKSRNTSSQYVEVFSSFVQKFYGLHQIVFIRLINGKMAMLLLDLINKSTKKLEISGSKMNELNQFLLKNTLEYEFKNLDKNFLEEFIPNLQNESIVIQGIKKHELFIEEQQVFFTLTYSNNYHFSNLGTSTIDFSGPYKLLQIFLDIHYLDQYFNLFLFKNLDSITLEFFRCFFINFDFLIMLRILSHLETEENLIFTQNKNFSKENPKIIIYKYDCLLGIKIHQQSQYSHPQLKQFFKEIKKISFQLILFKQTLLQELDMIQLYTENTQQHIFYFNEKYNLVFTNKPPSSLFKDSIQKKKLDLNNLNLETIFKSQELISHSRYIIQRLIQTKKTSAKIESLQIHYQLVLDNCSKEFKGFILKMEKNTFSQAEIQSLDIFTKINSSIFFGNKLFEVKQLTKKKKKPLNQNYKEQLSQKEELQNMEFDIKDNQIQDSKSQINDENSVINSVNETPKVSNPDQKKSHPQMKKAQKNFFSPLLERSPSYFAPQQKPTQYVKKVENFRSNSQVNDSFGFDSINDNKSQISKKKIQQKIFSDEIEIEELKELFKTTVTFEQALQEKQKLKIQADFLFNWNFNILESEEKFIQGTILTIFDPFLSHMQITDSVFYEFTQDMFYFYQRNQNPFHNYKHGVMVCYSTNYLVNKIPLLNQSLDQTFNFAFLLAAYGHDLDHPGTNNNFEINSHSPLAIRYSDQSPLEYHHLYQLFTLLSNQKYQFFKLLQRDIFKQIREFIIEVVVATDMKFHFHHLENSKKLTESLDLNDFETLKSISGLILHTTDLSHTSKESQIAECWARRVSIEFSEVYEKEQELNLPLTPFYKDLELDEVFYKSEMNFMTFIILPLFQAMENIFKNRNSEQSNDILSKITQQVQKNITYYQIKYENSQNKQFQIIQIFIFNFIIIYYYLFGHKENTIIQYMEQMTLFKISIYHHKRYNFFEKMT